MQIPVLKQDQNGSCSLHLISIEDVLYICVENRNLVYHTKNDSYRHISTLSDWEDHLIEYGFDLTDKTNLVNISKIKKLDSKSGKLYFDEHPTKQSKFASIAFIKQKLFKSTILRAISNNTQSSMEYAMKRQPSSTCIQDNKAPHQS